MRRWMTFVWILFIHSSALAMVPHLLPSCETGLERPSLSALLNEARNSLQGRVRMPELLLLPWDLKQGDQIFADSRALTAYPEILEKQTQWPLPLTFIEVRDSVDPVYLYQFKKYFLKQADGTIISLSGPEIHRHTSRHQADLPSHNFQIGETVQIEATDKTGLSFWNASGKVDHLGPREIFPIVGVYRGFSNTGRARVDFEIWDDGALLIPRATFEVPVSSLAQLPSGLRLRTEQRLGIFDQIQFHFSIGQVVRARLQGGAMIRARILEEENGLLKLEGIGGARKNFTFTAPSSAIFPEVPGLGAPQSVVYQPGWLPEKMGGGFTPLLTRTLNAAARVTGHPDFAEQTFQQKLHTLNEFVKTFLPWTDCMKRAVAVGLKKFDDLIEAGAGVCRHNATLLTMILKEAGFEANLVEKVNADKVGHVWVEVVERQKNGHVQVWVVDPSGTDPIRIEEVGKDLGYQNSSKEFYLDPARKVTPPLPVRPGY
jgi:hypothetical protein